MFIKMMFWYVLCFNLIKEFIFTDFLFRKVSVAFFTLLKISINIDHFLIQVACLMLLIANHI